MAPKSLVYFVGHSALRCLVTSLAMHTPQASLAYHMHYTCHKNRKPPEIHISTLASRVLESDTESGFFFLIKLPGGEKMQAQLTYFK